MPHDLMGNVELTESFQYIFDLVLNQKTKGVLSSLIKGEFIEKNETDGKILYKLTDKGYTALCLEFPFFRFLKEEWDGKWRIISYEIPEKKRELRDRLRREMRGWGLGPWHRSFWLTPHPIINDLRELVYGKEEDQYIQAFESTHVFGDMAILVEKVWLKTDIEKKYRELFKTWHQTLSSDATRDDKLKTILSGYVEMLRLDPGLPAGLIGQKWIGFEAFNLLKEIKSILLR
jgi:phenylacetic acid degradation operon negative regulatory protein